VIYLLGGGALTVTSTALIADVIPLRLRGWLEAHEVNSGQRQPAEEAIGRITLRLVREADVEARRAGLPRATAAAAQ
jgi:hypothetical protein